LILALVPAPSAAVTRAVSERFGVTRQAVSHHVTALVNAGLIEASGKTRARTLNPKRVPRVSRSRVTESAKAIIPVDLVRCGDRRLVSRAQAKRLMKRLERFHAVILDFTGIEAIGQAFADEVFRVFVNEHPDVELTYTGAGPEVEKMIKRAKATDVGGR
jgi:DNA-binding transcriptional ArsR family regulator